MHAVETLYSPDNFLNYDVVGINIIYPGNTFGKITNEQNKTNGVLAYPIHKTK
jgi:hypothetical protein